MRTHQMACVVALVAVLLAVGCATWAAVAEDASGSAKELATQRSITQHGITWTFDKPVKVGRFVTGDYYVVGPATITAISPAPSGDGKTFRNGSMLNPPTTTEHAYDGRIRGFVAAKVAKVPLVLKPGDSLLTSVSLEAKQQNKILANPTKSGEISPIRTIAVLTCLRAAVPADAFRPGYCDTKKDKILLARNIRWEQLPKVKAVETKLTQPWVGRYHKDAFGKDGIPTFAWMERVFERPWGDHIYGWHSRSMHASENLPGYGREVGRAVSYGALLLCCDYPKAKKEALCQRFIQVGIDNWAVAKRSKRGSSGGWPAAGGFGNGRKLPVVFAALLLGDAEMLQIRKHAGEASFGEDEHVEWGDSWTGAKVRFTGQYPLIGHKQIDRGPYEHLHPSKWPGKGKRKTMSEGYRRCCTSICWVGQALAARMMKAETVWDHDPFFAYVDRWMYEDDTKAIEEMGKAYPGRFGPGGIRQGSTHFDPWIDAMWKAYRTTLDAPTDAWKTGPKK